MLQYSDFLIKICQKEEYVQDILAGNIYMNELKWFNSIPDSFRGDRYDGHRYHKIVDNEPVFLCLEVKGINPSSIKLPLPPKSVIAQSFIGADKIPLFCAVQLDENIVESISPNEYKFKKSVIEHMEQFGNHVVILSKRELMAKMEEYANKNNVKIHAENVRYVNEKSSIPRTDSWEEQIKEFLFVKTVSPDRAYTLQNEWRMAITYPQVISDNENHKIIHIGELEYAMTLPSIDWLKEGTLKVEVK